MDNSRFLDIASLTSHADFDRQSQEAEDIAISGEAVVLPPATTLVRQSLLSVSMSLVSLDGEGSEDPSDDAWNHRGWFEG